MTTPALRLHDPAAEARPGPLPLLSREPLPETHWPYYSKKLEAYWLIDVKGWQPPALVAGPEPVAVYRLTPAAYAWFAKAVANLCASADKSKEAKAEAAARWAVDRLGELADWLTARGLWAETIRCVSHGIEALPQSPAFFDVDTPTPKLDFAKSQAPLYKIVYSGYLTGEVIK